METQSPLADLLSLSALSVLLLSIHPSYLLFSFSVRQSHHLCSTSSRWSPFPLFISSWGSFFVFSSLLFLGPPLFFSPAVLLSPSVRHLCRLEFVGPRQKVFLFFFFFSFFINFKCACWTQEGGEATPGTTWPIFIENMRRFRNWSPASAFPQLFICCCFWIFFKLQHLECLTRTDGCFRTVHPWPSLLPQPVGASLYKSLFFPSWLAFHLNFSVTQSW